MIAGNNSMNITQSIVSERDRALLGGDYDTYHTQCVRRLHTLRRRLGVSTPRGRKFTPKSPVSAEDIGKNVEWVYLLLASSERAWAHAMSMKAAQSPENTQKQMPGSTKKQIVSRYRRSVAYANNLVDAVSERGHSKATEIDTLEARAYLSLLKAGMDFEKQKWISCLSGYAVVRQIYMALGKGSKAEIYRELLSSTVDPSIRYVAHQLKFPRSKAVPDIAIESFPQSEQKLRNEIQVLDPEAFKVAAEQSIERTDRPQNLPTTITWRTRQVKVEDASISQSLGLALEREAALTDTFKSFQTGGIAAKELATAYDDVINARQDAVEAAKASIDELKTEGVDQGDARIQMLQITRTAVNYAVIESRIGRNRVLCGTDDGLLFDAQKQRPNTKKPQSNQARPVKEESTGRKLARLRERVALYESILQSINAVKELPGVIADTSFTSELEAKYCYFRSLKCLAIGRSQSIDGNVTHALALYARAADLAVEAERGLKPTTDVTSTFPKFEITSAQVQNLKTQMTTLTLQYQALAELKSLTEKSSAKKESFYDPPLVQRLHLNQYEGNIDLTNLVNYPPKLQPVPVKPLFFDLAWNYIQYPGRSTDSETTPTASNGKVTQPASEPVQEQKPTKRGWFGFSK